MYKRQPFPTAGHPWSTEAAHQDVADRRLLNRRVLFVGDEIAAVIAEDEIACQKALKLIEVDYEEYCLLYTSYFKGNIQEERQALL